MRLGSVLLVLLSVLPGLAHPALAQKNDGVPYKGIWVSTPFPSFNASAGATVTLDLTVHNSGLPPQVVKLGTDGLPAQWSAVFLGEGKRVESVFVAPNGSASLKLRLEPSATDTHGTHRFSVVAAGSGSRFALPIDLAVGESLPPKLTLKAELPELRGSPSSDFDFKVKVRNDGGDDAMVRFDTNAPPSFRVKITEQYGSQELTSLPLKVGEEKTVTAKITPAFDTKAGSYPVSFTATTGKATAVIPLTMQVTGEPKLLVTGVDDRLSASAEAGEESPVEVVVTNSGSAPAHNIKLASTPPSGWKVTFQPASLDLLPPNAKRTVTALVVPAQKAIAGDYMVTVRADGTGVDKSSDFRITVRTSTMWGIVGVLVIGAALIVLVLAMVRFGRR